MDDKDELIDQINEERYMDAAYKNLKLSMKQIMRELKIVHDSGMEEGFTESQANTFCNTYFNIVINNRMYSNS